MQGHFLEQSERQYLYHYFPVMCNRRFEIDHLAGYADMLLTTAATLQTMVNAKPAWEVCSAAEGTAMNSECPSGGRAAVAPRVRAWQPSQRERRRQKRANAEGVGAKTGGAD